MKKCLEKTDLRPGDQAWLVTDRDRWDPVHLDELAHWAESDEKYGFALSNPNFEFWLLLHFEHGRKLKSAKDCLSRLRDYIPNYEKDCSVYTFSDVAVKSAIERAQKRDLPPCDAWPKKQWATTVYRLVANIIGDGP